MNRHWSVYMDIWRGELTDGVVDGQIYELIDEKMVSPDHIDDVLEG